MRPPPRSSLAAAPRPAKLVLGGDLTMGPLSQLSPQTEAELLGLSGVFDELGEGGGWLGVTPGKGGVAQSFGRMGAQQPAAAAAGATLRCIDGTHAAGCALCTPAPPAGEEASYELTGEIGKKNGEKRCVLPLAPRITGARGRRTALWGRSGARGLFVLPVPTCPPGVTFRGAKPGTQQRGGGAHAARRGVRASRCNAAAVVHASRSQQILRPIRSAPLPDPLTPRADAPPQASLAAVPHPRVGLAG